jgi:plastocyanin
MTDSLAAYQMSFAGAPAGKYDYFCLPHEALGMKASLTLQP